MEEDALFEVPAVVRKRRRPSQPRDHIAEVRRFHGWTLDKLQVFHLYLTQYRRVAGSGTYIDGFAGTGTASIRGEGRPGSPRIALDAGAFKSLHLFERERVVDSLRRTLCEHYSPKRLQRVVLHEGDCNIGIPQLLASGDVPVDRPCFALLDQDSTQLAWSTVECLARFKQFFPGTKQCKVEQWILFNTHQAISRLWPRDRTRYPLPPHAGVLDRVMGQRDAWLDLYKRPTSVVSLVTRYSQRLRDDLGYQYVVPHPIRDPGTNRVQYHMIHATDHPAAIEFMRWATRIPTAELARQAQLPM